MKKLIILALLVMLCSCATHHHYYTVKEEVRCDTVMVIQEIFPAHEEVDDPWHMPLPGMDTAIITIDTYHIDWDSLVWDWSNDSTGVIDSCYDLYLDMGDIQ